METNTIREMFIRQTASGCSASVRTARVVRPRHGAAVGALRAALVRRARAASTRRRNSGWSRIASRSRSLSSKSRPKPCRRADSSRRRASPTVVGVLPRRQSVDAGDLIDIEWIRIPGQCFAGVGVCGLTAAEPSVQYTPAGERRHVSPGRSRAACRGPRRPLRCRPRSLGENIRLVLEGRQIAWIAA